MANGLIAEGDGSVLVGSDAATQNLNKPAVEVVFSAHRPGVDGAPLDAESSRASRIAAGIAKMAAAHSGGGKAAPAVISAKAAPPTETVSQVEAASDTVEESAETDDTPEPGAKPTEVVLDEGEQAAETEESPAEAEAAPTEAEAKVEEAKPDAVALAAHKAEIDQLQNELALSRARLAHVESGHVPDDDRQSWLRDPVASLQKHIARILGVKPDHASIETDLAFLQRELTRRAIGDDALSSEGKQQRTSERWDRQESLKEIVQTASKETTGRDAQRKQVVDFVTTAINAVKDEYPYLGLATELDRRAPAEVAVDLFTAAVQSGRLRSAGDEADLREALRLTNDHYRARAERIAKLGLPNNSRITAPTPVTTPVSASATSETAGAPKQKPSTAPAKPGIASPKTLSAKQAAAAPVAKVTPTHKTGIIEIDPTDRDARDARRAEIARRHLMKK